MIATLRTCTMFFKSGWVEHTSIELDKVARFRSVNSHFGLSQFRVKYGERQ